MSDDNEVQKLRENLGKLADASLITSEQLDGILNYFIGMDNAMELEEALDVLVEMTGRKKTALNKRVKELAAIRAEKKKERAKFIAMKEREEGGKESQFKSQLPSTAYYRSGGRIFYEWEKDGDTLRVPVCADLELIAMTKDVDEQRWSVRIGFLNRVGEVKEIDVPHNIIQSDERRVYAKLADAGFWMSTDATAKRAFIALLNDSMPEKVIRQCYTPGWQGDNQFVTPLGEVLRVQEEEEDEIVLHESMRAHDGEKKGSLESWQDAVHRGVVMDKTPHWGLGLCLGVAAVIVDRLNEDSFGVNIFGSSTRGKSTMQIMAASMWANPRPDYGVLHNFRTTDNGMEALLERGNGVGCHLDELAQMPDTRFLAKFVFMIAGGTGKKRMQANTEDRKSKRWRTVITVSSERALSTIIAKESRGEEDVSGLYVRLPGINVSNLQAMDYTVAKKVNEDLKVNYGWAGPEFVRTLMDISEESLREAIEAKTKFYMDKTNVPTIRRAARQFGILATCGDILALAGVVDEKRVNLQACVDWAWETWTGNFDIEKLSPVEYSIEALKTWLQTNPGKVKNVLDAEASNQEVLAYHDADTVYLLKSSLTKIPGIQSDLNTLMKELDNKELLQWQGKNRLHTYIPKVGESRTHIRINWRLYGGDEELEYANLADEK
jgi:hypothetical protein